MILRPALRRGIRSKIFSWPEAITTVFSQQAAGATTLVVTDASDMEARDLLEVGEEIQRIKSVAGTTITVTRADRETAAVLHAAGATVRCWPFWGWSDIEVNDAINEAIRWLRPDVYLIKYFQNTALAGKKEFGVPPGTIYPTHDLIKRVELQDSDSKWVPISNWAHIGDRLQFGAATDQDYPIRITVQSAIRELANDTTQIDNDDVVNAIIHRAAAELFDSLLGNRPRYMEYSATLNDRASTPDEIQRLIYTFRNQADLSRERASRAPLSGFASSYRGT